MQDDPDLQMIARVSLTFHLDPVRVLNAYSPVQLAALLAAHNVVAADQNATVVKQREELDRARKSGGSRGR